MPKIKGAYLRLSKANGFCTKPQKGDLSLYFDFFSPPNAKRSTIKRFLKVSLVSLTFTIRTVLFFLKNCNFAMLVQHGKMGSL